jgi:hypothetical protein
MRFLYDGANQKRGKGTSGTSLHFSIYIGNGVLEVFKTLFFSTKTWSREGKGPGLEKEEEQKDVRVFGLTSKPPQLSLVSVFLVYGFFFFFHFEEFIGFYTPGLLDSLQANLGLPGSDIPGP